MVAFNPVCIKIKNKYEVSFCTDEKGRKKKTNTKNKTKTKPRAVFESYLKSEAA